MELSWAETVKQAHMEGLQLIPSLRLTRTNFACVHPYGKTGTFWIKCIDAHSFATPEAAVLMYAHHLGPKKS